MPLSARPSFEGALLTSVRRQIEAFEGKVGDQIHNLRCQQQRDRIREAALSRLEEKLSAVEGLQPRFDQRMAELTGNIKGLSDEMQAQVRRVDLIDDRLCEWRHQTEEEFRHRHANLEKSVQKNSSDIHVMTVSVEERHRGLTERIQALEADIQERFALQEEICQSLTSAWERLHAIEDHQATADAVDSAQGHRSIAPCESASAEATTAALLLLLEQQIADLASKVHCVVEDMRDAHAALATQEEQQKALRTLLEASDEHLRVLAERVEHGGWDRRLDRLQQALEEEAMQRMDHLERMELMEKHIQYQEQACSELSPLRWRIPLGSSDDSKSAHSCKSAVGSTAEERVPLADFQECKARLTESEAGLSVLALSLKEVMPKLFEQEIAIRDLQTRREDAGIASRIGQVEGKVCQLTQSVAMLSANVPVEEQASLFSDGSNM